MNTRLPQDLMALRDRVKTLLDIVEHVRAGNQAPSVLAHLAESFSSLAAAYQTAMIGLHQALREGQDKYNAALAQQPDLERAIAEVVLKGKTPPR